MQSPFNYNHFLHRHASALRALLLTSGLALSLGQPVHAASYYWDTASGTWQTGANWSNNATSGGATGTVPGALDTAQFNQSGVNGTEAVQLSADAPIAKITFNNTGVTVLKSDSATTRNLTIGSTGIVVNSGAGAATIGDATNGVSVTLNASESWVNNSASTLSVLNPVYLSNVSGTGNVLTIGSGQTTNTGATTISGAISNFNGGSGTAGSIVVQTGSTAAAVSTVTTLAGNNTFTGGVTLKDGTLALGNNNALGTGSLTITASTAYATGIQASGGARTISNVINITSTTASVTGSNALELSGAVTFAGSTNFSVTNSALTTLSGGFNLTNNTTARSISISGSGDILINSAVSDSAGATASNLSYYGTGMMTLSGTNSVRGNLAINAGSVKLDGTSGGSSAIGGTVSVATGVAPLTPGSPSNQNTTNATLYVKGNYTLGTSTTGSLRVNGGLANGTLTQGTLSLVDGTINTLTLANAAGNTLSIGGTTAGTSAVLNMEVGATSDQIALSGVAKTTIGSSSTANVVNLTGLGNFSGTTQTLINSPGGLTSGSFSNFVLGTTTGNFSGYTVALGSSSTALTLSETANAAAANAYWNGGAAAVSGQGGTTAWNSFVNGNTNTSNFGTAPGGTGNAKGLVGSSTNIFFDSGVASTLSTSLGQDLTVNSLTFSSGNGVTIGGGNTLTLLANGVNSNTAGNGITVATGSANDTLSTNVALGNDQTWTVTDASNTLTDSGVLSGNHALTKAGAGKLAFTGSSANTNSGLTSVNNGELDLGKTSAVAVAGNLTIGDGTGTADSAIVKLTGTGGNQIANGSALSLNTDGELDLNGNTETVASLSSTDGDIASSTSGGNLTVLAGPSFGSTSGTNRIGAGATVTSSTAATLASSSSLAVNGTLSDALTASSGATISGTGTITGAVSLAGNNNLGSSGTLTTGNTTVGGTGNHITGGIVGGGANTVNGEMTVDNGATWKGTNITDNGVLTLATNSNLSGTGALTVNAGATLQGTGTSATQSFSVAGSSAGGQANVLVGHTVGDTNTTGMLTLNATNSSSFGATTLQFNLNAGTPGEGNELAVGSTSVTFNTVDGLNVTLALSLNGDISGTASYLLIAGDNSSLNNQYAGITTFLNADGRHEINTGSIYNLDYSITGGTTDHSYLYIQDDNIYVAFKPEATPEPSTWVLMITGLGVVLYWRRRQNCAKTVAI